MPERSVGVYFAAFAHGVFYGYMRERTVHAADDHIRLACHGGVYRIFGELVAEDGIGALGGDTAHGVARVKVLDVDFLAHLFEVFLDFERQEFTNVFLEDVAACVAAFFLAVEQVLACAFGDGEHGMRLAAVVAVFERLEEPVLAFEREGDFGDEAEVHDGGGKCRIGGDKSGVTAHELHEAEPVKGAIRLVVGARDDVGRAEHGGLETERAVDEVQIVVDGLRDADDRDGLLALFDFLRDGVRAAKRAVAADAEQHIDVQAHQGVDHDGGFLVAAGAAEDSAAVVLDGVNHVWVEHNGRIAVRGIEPTVAVRDAKDVADAVVEPEHGHEALDNVVQTRAEAAAGDNAGAGPCRVVENGFARAGSLERGDFDTFAEKILQFLCVGSERDAV